jgi:hypothetical protein
MFTAVPPEAQGGKSFVPINVKDAASAGKAVPFDSSAPGDAKFPHPKVLGAKRRASKGEAPKSAVADLGNFKCRNRLNPISVAPGPASFEARYARTQDEVAGELHRSRDAFFDSHPSFELANGE